MNELIGYKVIKGRITVINGLHIGAGRESMEIGGTDSPIMRHPITYHPYVPGSSIKGKMRSLLELKYCANRLQSGKPCGCGDCIVCNLFGSSDSKKPTMTRVIFRDAFMTPDSLKKQEEAAKEGSEGYYAEIKNEISMNRQTMTAQKGGLRTLERIIAGSELDFEISIRVFKSDPIDDYVSKIKEGFKLIENDTLGGSGSRGYGKVTFEYTIEDVKV